MSFMFNLPSVRGKYRFDVKLSRICWFGAGGTAKLLFIPSDVDDLSHFLKNIDMKTDVFVLGVGSNILVRDGGFNGVMIRLGNNFNDIIQLNNHEYMIKVGAAVLDKNVALFAMEKNIGGMEFLSGIPGTIGGAIAMNAGSYGGDMSAITHSIEAMDHNGMLQNFSNKEIGYRYRGNNLSRSLIFISATLMGYRSDMEDISSKIASIDKSRNATQPVKGFKTGGSTFKNPSDIKAWQLIDGAGCRGLRIGAAQISDLHCNFLINLGTATAADIENLILEVQRRVFENSGYKLEPEIVIVGEKQLV